MERDSNGVQEAVPSPEMVPLTMAEAVGKTSLMGSPLQWSLM